MSNFSQRLPSRLGKALQLLSTVAAISPLVLSATSFAADVKTPAIPGVVKEGTLVQFIKEGFEGTEGPIAAPDGSLLFTETRANRITKIAADNTISSFLENSNGSNGLAFAPNGDLITVQVNNNQVGVIYPKGREKVLTNNFEGQPFQRTNDLVLAKNGGIYFTDSGPGQGVVAEPKTGVYYISPEGKTKRVVGINEIERPNGIQLSRDEKTLYVANTGGEYVLSFSINADGTLKDRKNFAKIPNGLQKNEQGALSSGADGLAIDAEGRLYVTSNAGVDVFDEQGKFLGGIPVPHKPQNVAFAGKDKKTLYIVGRGAAYKVAVLTPGFAGRVK
ncbi:SMP-30/gluconolactonase/LRE family protein [Cellvibrio fontiphilus]|uniref:SMP-30/gluconolactonase/LRE family protein n=1 Tax=Cellvibrio fontiphilus TaxID=1815559 RepID=A0ABV7FEY8_9GAMM